MPPSRGSETTGRGQQLLFHLRRRPGCTPNVVCGRSKKMYWNASGAAMLAVDN